MDYRQLLILAFGGFLAFRGLLALALDHRRRYRRRRVREIEAERAIAAFEEAKELADLRDAA